MIKNPFEDFIKEEYEYIYDGDNVSVLLDGFDGEISEEEFYDNYNEFLNKAVEAYCNNDYIIQQMHDNMHDELVDVLKQYLIDNR